MESDIVELARERAISYRDCGPSAEHTAAMLDELASHIERLRAELVSKADELASAIKQRDEARRDAQRYRWLKSKGCQWITIYRHPSGDEFFDGKADERMDERIDAARTRDEEGGGA